MRSGVAVTGRSIAGLVSSLVSFRGAIAGIGVVAAGRQLVEAADNYSSLRARLELVTRAGTDVEQVLGGIAAVAERARAPAGELTSLYQRNADALQTLGKSTEDSLRFTESLSKALTISGTSGASASAALFQLSQALNDGKLRGEEFNSVSEQAPEILRIITRETGKTRGELRKLAEEGKLTSDVVVNSLLNASKEIDEKFAKIPQTAGNAFTVLADEASRVFGRIAQESGVSQSFAAVFNDIREAIGGTAFQSAARTAADLLTAIGNGFREVIAFIGEARLAFIGWRDAIAETSAFKALASALATIRDGAIAVGVAFGAVTSTAGAAFDAGSPIGQLSTRAKEISESVRAIDSFRTTVTRGGSPLDASAAGAKVPIKFGAGEDVEAEKRAKKVREQLERQVELETLKNELTRAEIAGETTIVSALQNQLDIKGKISAEQRKASPELARQLEAQILLNNELDRQKELTEKSKATAGEFAGAITDAFRSATLEGGKFGDVLKDLGKRLVSIALEAAVFAPLQKSLTTSISGSGVAGALASVSTSLGFANGGVFDRPVSFRSGGTQGVLGEAGPEAIMPLKRGSDGRLGVAAASGSGGGVTNVTINVAGDATEKTVAEMRRVAREEFTRGAPGVVRESVAAVRNENTRNPNFLRR